MHFSGFGVDEMKQLLGAVLLALVSGAASAATIVAQIGDVDGFGQCATFGSGSRFAWSTVCDNGTGDGDGTDTWVYGDRSFTFAYDLGWLPIKSATLEVFAGGVGLKGKASVLLDGQMLGKLRNGNDDGQGNYAYLDIFDISPDLIRQPGGSNQLMFDLVNDRDGWVLDYVKLSITVPEPGGLALLAIGLIAAGYAGRNTRKTGCPA